MDAVDTSTDTCLLAADTLCLYWLSAISRMIPATSAQPTANTTAPRRLDGSPRTRGMLNFLVSSTEFLLVGRLGTRQATGPDISWLDTATGRWSPASRG